MPLKKILLLTAAIIAALVLFYPQLLVPVKSSPAVVAPQHKVSSDDSIAQAFASQRSDLQVSGQGTVEKVLPDDRRGSKHQRFILRLANGQTLLVAHNIDLAPRIPNLRSGDTVEFYGEYEWSHQGGVLHWTHHDPRGQHVPGWLQHQGQRYQ